MNKVPMTVAGEKSLREELNHLKGEARPQVIAAIAEAREHGDLKENAEYTPLASSKDLLKAVSRKLKASFQVRR